MTTQSVTFSVPHTTWDGTTHKPDTTADLSAVEARHVLAVGHGRQAEKTAPKNADATETEGTTARRTQKKEKADG